jgi:hypothetical protein
LPFCVKNSTEFFYLNPEYQSSGLLLTSIRQKRQLDIYLTYPHKLKFNMPADVVDTVYAPLRDGELNVGIQETDATSSANEWIITGQCCVERLPSSKETESGLQKTHRPRFADQSHLTDQIEPL